MTQVEVLRPLEETQDGDAGKMPVASFEEVCDALELLGSPVAGPNAVCSACGASAASKPEMMACSRCHHALYCNAECQKKAWKAHKPICTHAIRIRPTLSWPFPAFSFAVPSGATVTASLTSIGSSPPAVDVETAPRELFRLDSAVPTAVDEAAVPEEDDSGDGGGLERLQQVIAQRTAGVPPSLLPVAATDDLVERLQQSQDVVDVATLAFTVPLTRPVTVRITVADRDKKLTRADVAVCIARIYRILYAADAATDHQALGLVVHRFDDLCLHSLLQVGPAPNDWSVVIDT